jgi:methionyl-tRNA formyltransferase
MLWRLPPSVRSLLLSNQRSCNSTKAVDPLKILFCGSDEFSIASLRALHNAKETDPKLIESIDVLHRPGKRTGRGLKIVREGNHKEKNKEIGNKGH